MAKSMLAPREIFISNLQCEHRAGEQEEHALSKPADRAYLIAQDQQFGWSVHSRISSTEINRVEYENCEPRYLLISPGVSHS